MADPLPAIKKYCKQDGVYWAPLPSDPDNLYNERLYDDPIDLKVRWEDEQQEIILSDDSKATSKARIMCDQPVELGGVLFLGDTSELTDLDDPFNNDKAWKIIKIETTPNVRAKKALYEAYV